MAGTSESGTSSRVNSNLLHKESEPFKGTEPPPDHLSPAQERRLRTWLEEQFLALDQMYNKRYILHGYVIYVNSNLQHS